MEENSWWDSEWQGWHQEAALELRAFLKENGQLANLRAAIRTKDFFGKEHFFFGMAVRNWLRKNGYSEQDMNVKNLDDHYVHVMLLAVGYDIEGGYNPWMSDDEMISKLVTIFNDTKDSNPTSADINAAIPQSSKPE